MNSTFKQIKNTIIGAFFGAIYSIVLVGPLIVVYDEINPNPLWISGLILSLIIIFAFLIIFQSFKWMNKFEERVSSLPLKIENKISTIIDVTLKRVVFPDFALVILLLTTSYFMIEFGALPGWKNAVLWMIGVVVILILQILSIPTLVE